MVSLIDYSYVEVGIYVLIGIFIITAVGSVVESADWFIKRIKG